MAIEDILQSLLTEIKGLRSDLTKGVKAATADKPAASKPADKPADKPAADKPAANKPAANKPAAEKPKDKPAAGGKPDETAVRAAIREVATHENLGKQEALDILDENGGGVQNVSALKPEYYAAVIEACKTAIAGAGPKAASSDPDDPLA